MSVIKSGKSTHELEISSNNAAKVEIHNSDGSNVNFNTLNNYVSTINSTVAALTAGASFTGIAEDIYLYNSAIISLLTDKDGTLYVDFSTDGTNWDSTLTFTVIGGTNKVHRLTVTRRYIRVRYTNGAVNQTYMRLQTMYGGQTTLSSPLNIPIQSDADATVSRPLEPFLQLSADKFTGYSTYNKFGRNTDIDIGTEDLWIVGGTWVAPTTNRIHDIVSSDVNDTAAGTGARTVYIEGLNSSYNITTETITLNGAVNVPTVNSYVIIHRMYVLTSGSGGTNAGNITATAQTDATITCRIATGKAQTQLAIFQVPANKTAYLLNYYGSITTGTALDLELYIKPFGGTYNLKNTLGLNVASTSSDEHRFLVPMKITEKSIIKLSGTATANNTTVTGGFDFILIDN